MSMSVDEKVHSSEAAEDRGVRQRLDPPHRPRREARSPIMGPVESRRIAHSEVDRDISTSKADSLSHDDVEVQLAKVVEAEIALQRRLRQASELAGHLRQRQDELDRRESELNARAAAMEHEERLTRLWVDEKVLTVNEDRRHLAGEAESLLVEREAFIVQQEEAQQELNRRKQDLDQQSDTVERERLAFAHITRQVQWEHDSALQRARATEERAREREAEAEAEVARAENVRLCLDHQLRQIREDATDLHRTRQQIRQLLREGQDAIQARHESWQKEQEQAQFEIRRRQLQIDERDRRLSEKQQSVANTSRELLEHQIGVQQLWAKICPESEREMATRRIGFLRLQLQELFAAQIKQSEDAVQDAERQSSESRLAEIHLEKRKEQMSDWLFEQKQAHEIQLARLRAEAQRLRCWEARLETRRLQGIAQVTN